MEKEIRLLFVELAEEVWNILEERIKKNVES